MRTFTWEDAEEIALALLAKFPNQNPLRIRFTDLRNWVTQLEVGVAVGDTIFL